MPQDVFQVIGVKLDLGGVPETEAALEVTEKRIEQLTKTIQTIKSSGRFGSGGSASLTGKLGFAICATFGRFGRAKLRAYIRRCGEDRVGMNPQILATNEF